MVISHVDLFVCSRKKYLPQGAYKNSVVRLLVKTISKSSLLTVQNYAVLNSRGSEFTNFQGHRPPGLNSLFRFASALSRPTLMLGKTGKAGTTALVKMFIICRTS